MRLALMGQILELAESGLGIHISSKSDFGKFYQDVDVVLRKLDELQKIISLIPGMHNTMTAFVCQLPYTMLCEPQGRRSTKSFTSTSCKFSTRLIGFNFCNIVFEVYTVLFKMILEDHGLCSLSTMAST